jgi:hypothetical protein
MKMKILLACGAAACLMFTAACGHETKNEIAKLEKDSSLQDDQALQKMAEACWIYTSGDSEKFTARKRPNGVFTLTGQAIDKLGVTSLKQDNLVLVNMLTDAKFMWRLFRAGMKRGLDEVVFSRIITLMPSGTLELYRVRINLAQLKAIPGWDTADPYDVGEYDLLNSPEAKEVEKKIIGTWTVEVNNGDKVKVR